MTDKSNWHVKGGFPTTNHLVDDLQKTMFFVFLMIVIIALGWKSYHKTIHHRQFRIVKTFWRQYTTVIAE